MNIYYQIKNIFSSTKVEPYLGDYPYRRPAEMPVEKLPKTSWKFPRPNIKMPAMKLSKPVYMFLHLLPISAAILGVGMIHDAPYLSNGVRWAAGIATILFAFFFVGHFFKVWEE